MLRNASWFSSPDYQVAREALELHEVSRQRLKASVSWGQGEILNRQNAAYSPFTYFHQSSNCSFRSASRASSTVFTMI